MKKKKQDKKYETERISLYPLKPERAISDIFKIDPKKIEAAEKRKAKRKKK